MVNWFSNIRKFFPPFPIEIRLNFVIFAPLLHLFCKRFPLCSGKINPAFLFWFFTVFTIGFYRIFCPINTTIAKFFRLFSTSFFSFVLTVYYLYGIVFPVKSCDEDTRFGRLPREEPVGARLRFPSRSIPLLSWQSEMAVRVRPLQCQWVADSSATRVEPWNTNVYVSHPWFIQGQGFFYFADS